jgi:hypothetical protein
VYNRYISHKQMDLRIVPESGNRGIVGMQNNVETRRLGDIVVLVVLPSGRWVQMSFARME